MLQKSFTLFLLLSFYTVNTLLAQNSLLQRSDELTKKGEVAKAYQLLQKYQYTNAKNVDFVWKLAKLAYWNSDIDAAKTYYNSVLKLDRNNFNIKLDYAKMLYELGDYQESSELLKQYLVHDNTSEDISTLLVKAKFYDGKVKNAEQLITTLPLPIQSSIQIKQLKEEIAIYKALNIGLSVAFTNDDQPLKTLMPKIKIGKQENHFINWSVEAAFNNFSNDTLSSSAQTIQAVNKFHFRKLGLDANVLLGATILNSNNKSSIIGGILLSKKISSAFALELEAIRNPYYYSIPSTNVLVTQDNIGGALVINNLAKFTGRFQIQQQIYNDNNKINSTSGWVLSPSLTGKNFQTKIGYSFDNTDSDNDNFTPVKSLNEIIQNYANSQVIDGIYNPYFTPNHQKTQSALLWFLLKPTKHLEINFTGTYALSATFENPILFLNTDDLNQTVFDKAFLKQKYKPANYRAGITYTVNKKFSSALNYEYFKSAYYIANTFMLSLNYRLINEK